jgi:uncharacterized protein YidB (DUF937 family)
MMVSAIGTGRAVEVLHDRGPAMSAGGDRWTAGSGYLIGSGLVLTAAHNVDYRRDLGDGEQLLVRTIEGNLLAARVVLVCDEMSRVDLAMLEISDPRFGEQLLPVTFARVDRDSPAPIKECWAVGFPRFGEAGPVLPGGSRRETWQVSGQILPGGKRRAGLLSLQVTSTPSASLGGQVWEGMSGALVFAADAHDGKQAAVGVISTHHRPEGESALTVVPVTAVAELAAAAEWWRQFGVPAPDRLPVLPRQRGRTGPVRPAPAAGWPLEEVTDPFALEVHRPVQPEDAPPGLPVLPPYVPREHDEVLGQVVRAAAGGRSGIAVLVGGSSTGKTRACWEGLALLRDQDPPWRLWHPIDPSRPDAALAELPGIGPRTVVWLNEAQFYLDPAGAGLGERVAAGLRELLRDPGRAPVLVLATMWPQFWDALTARPADGDDRHEQARELLAGHDITVPAAFTPAQLGQLAEVGDVRMVLAARLAPDGEVIQFLAGAPELLARYRHAPPAAAALIGAAMDARRLGMGPGLPQAFLEAAAPGYLTDAQWDALSEDWLDQALAYNAVLCKGARGMLTRIRARPARHTAHNPGDQPASTAAAAGPLYRLADYLDQHGRARRAGQVPPAEFWIAAAAHADPGDQAALGDAAHARGLYRDAAQLHKNAAATGNRHAIYYLSRPSPCLRTDPRPAHWAASHAALDDPHAIASLLDELRKAGAREQAAALARRAVAHVPLDQPGGIARLLASLRKTGAREQAAALLARDPAAHVPLDQPGAIASLLYSLCEAGADEQAAALLARDPAAHAALDNQEAVVNLLASLRKMGAREQATALARRAVAHVSLDDPNAVSSLLYSLQGLDASSLLYGLQGLDVHADALARRAVHVSLDNPKAVARLLAHLRKTGAQEQADALARRAADVLDDPYDDDPDGMASLLNESRKPSLLDESREIGTWEQEMAAMMAWHVADVSIGDPVAVVSLLDELREAGTDEQAAALLARDPAAHVSLDDPVAVISLLASLRKMGAQEQADALLARDPAAHAALDDPDAIASPREMGARDPADALARRAVAHVSLDQPGGIASLLARLREMGAREQADALARRAVAHVSLDQPGGIARLLDELREAGTDEQAPALLARDPAAHVSLDDPDDVAYLLASLLNMGAREQATALARRAADTLDDPDAVASLLARLRGLDVHADALARRAVAHVSLDQPGGIASLLASLREMGAREQAAALLARDPAAHVSLDDPDAVAYLLGRLRKIGAWEEELREMGARKDELLEMGAREQADALARRAAAHFSLDDPDAVVRLLASLRKMGAREQADALADRLPGAGMFELFREQADRQDRFRFGREANGSPARPWGWEDLD